MPDIVENLPTSPLRALQAPPSSYPLADADNRHRFMGEHDPYVLIGNVRAHFGEAHGEENMPHVEVLAWVARVAARHWRGCVQRHRGESLQLWCLNEVRRYIVAWVSMRPDATRTYARCWRLPPHTRCEGVSLTTADLADAYTDMGFDVGLCAPHLLEEPCPPAASATSESDTSPSADASSMPAPSAEATPPIQTTPPLSPPASPPSDSEASHTTLPKNGEHSNRNTSNSGEPPSKSKETPPLIVDGERKTEPTATSETSIGADASATEGMNGESDNGISSMSAPIEEQAAAELEGGEPASEPALEASTSPTLPDWWRRVLPAWWAKHGAARLSSLDVLDLCKSLDIEVEGASVRRQQVVLGRMLSELRARSVVASKSHNGSKVYFLPKEP